MYNVIVTLRLQAYTTTGALVDQGPAGGWRLEIPAGPVGRYRLAQLDDYRRLSRRAFSWHAPFNLSLKARASHASIPGTWGFGLWNDPFGLAFLQGGGVRTPALPNAAWFFFASPPNYLSLRDDLPPYGALAATFQSPGWPSWPFLAAIPFTPLLLIRPLARWMRRRARQIVKQDAVALAIDPAEQHSYRLEWRIDRVIFWVDNTLILDTPVVPIGPLGLVIWIDNQYAALPPDGRVGYGTLPNLQPAWIIIEDVSISSPYLIGT
jgi:hypothetical protein